MMPFSWGKLAAALAVVVMIAPVRAAVPLTDFQYVPWNQLSNQSVTDWGRHALGTKAERWKHGETTHFVIHCFQDGDKIARRSELFYGEIRDFFGNRRDLLGGRKSHIFAFNDVADWNKFMRTYTLGGLPPNTIGITRGNEFFYLSTGEHGQFDPKGKVQAHEMTHLVFNRFFRALPPLWLNEGIAEYFGQRKTTTLADFRREMGRRPKFSLNRLFSTDSYPRNPKEIEAFYAEAAIVVDFLTMTEDRRRLLPRFVDIMIDENDLAKAVRLYGYQTMIEFESDYNRYRFQF